MRLKPLFLNIKDKVPVSGKKGAKLCCPPHCTPHKLPFTKPISDESCHYHNSLWRMSHHAPFCYLLKCPHYKAMMAAYGKRPRGRK